MRDTWLVKTYEYVMRPDNPTAADVDFDVPYIWINSVTDTAYVLSVNNGADAIWAVKQPDREIVTSINTIYVIEDVDAVVAAVEGIYFEDRTAVVWGEHGGIRFRKES